jgi:hypothetical protein
MPELRPPLSRGRGALRPDGTATRPVPEVTHRAVARALEQAAAAEFLHDQAGQRLIETGGGLGAPLRFR